MGSPIPLRSDYNADNCGVLPATARMPTRFGGCCHWR